MSTFFACFPSFPCFTFNRQPIATQANHRFKVLLALTALALNASCSSVSLNPAPVYERNPSTAPTQPMPESAVSTTPTATIGSALGYQALAQQTQSPPIVTTYAAAAAPQAQNAIVAAPSNAGTVAMPKRTIIPDGNTYTVKKGDTLYSIALETGVSYRDLAQWNGISNPAYIQIDQVLVLNGVSSSVPSPTAIASPVASPVVSSPNNSGASIAVVPSPVSSVVSSPVSSPINSPNAVALPFPITLPSAGTAPSNVAAPAAVKPAPQPAPASELQWQWPSKTRPSAYIEGKSKGIDFVGVMGDPIFAAADGKVIYADNKLKGYGQMVIVKHNEQYLSAYAHNSKLLVQEEQLVKRGQKIAEMGNTDSDNGQTKLHFELRRSGKPVDPSKTLPAQ